MKWASPAKSRIASSSWTTAKSSKTRSRPISSVAPAATARKNSCPKFSRIKNSPKSLHILCGAAASQPYRRTRLDQIAYVNGSFVPLADAKVSVLDRGFLFADGIYEVAAGLEGKLIENPSLLARLGRRRGRPPLI